MDNGSLASEHEADSGLGSMNSVEPLIYVAISIPDLNIQKSFQFSPEESVWSAKQQILTSAAKDLKKGFNYGLFIPPTNGRAGKFLDEGRLLKEYPLSAPFDSLQLLPKRRIYKHVLATEKKMKQMQSKSNLRQLMEWVRKGDTEKVVKTTNQGLDPNFIDHDSGETPLTLAVSLEHPTRMIVSLVGGGAHLDFRNAKGLTPMHLAAIQGNEEAIKGLLDLGASANYYDLQGLTPAYQCVCHNASPRCLEMLLFDHAILGATDESNWTELHQACKWGRIQHLELMIYYGASLNSQNSGGNTPLHVCAVNSQEDCARVILFRGADKTIKNFANHNAYETAIISGNTTLAQIIRDFSEDDVVLYQEVPKLNEKRRVSLQSGGSSMGTLQRWHSNPQIHFACQDDRLSVKQNTLRHEYDLTLPRDLSYGAMRRPSDTPLVSEIFGVTLNQSHSRDIDLASKQGKSIMTSKNGFPLPRTVFLKSGKSGYGFILRGSRGSADNTNFVPTPEIPGLQYFSIIAEKSMAEQAGIRPRDFLLEVNGHNVRTASHDYTVHLIKEAKDVLCLVVVSPAELPRRMMFPVPDLAVDQNLSFHPTSDFIPQGSRSSGGLADLEALEQQIAATSELESRNEVTPRRLLLAPSMQILDRMAKTMGISTAHSTASIHTTHGKRMAAAVPLGETYQDVQGVCRGRISAVPNENSSVGNISRANSMHNLSSPELVNFAHHDEWERQKPRKFIPKESGVPFSRMLSVPDADVSAGNGKHWQKDPSHDNRQKQVEFMNQKGVRVDVSNTIRSPSLPLPPPPPPTFSRTVNSSVNDQRSSEDSVQPVSGVYESISPDVGVSFPFAPPQLPPMPSSEGGKQIRSLPALPSATTADCVSVMTMQNARITQPPPPPKTPLQNIRKLPDSNSVPSTPPPLPPLRRPPNSDSVPPFQTVPPKLSAVQTSRKSETVDRETLISQNSFLDEIQKKREQLKHSEDDSGKVSTASASVNRFLVSDLHQKSKQSDNKGSLSNHHQQEEILDQHDTEPVDMDDVSNISQEPFFNELSLAISSRKMPNPGSEEKTSVVRNAPNGLSVSGKNPAFPNKISAVQQRFDPPASFNAASSAEQDNASVHLVKLQPAQNRILPPKVIPPSFHAALPSPPPPKLNSTAQLKASGPQKKRLTEWNISTDEFDFDLPPPPPPPPPTFGDGPMEDFFLPLPPPPPPM